LVKNLFVKSKIIIFPTIVFGHKKAPLFLVGQLY